MRPWQIPGDPDHYFRPDAGLHQITHLYDFDRRSPAPLLAFWLHTLTVVRNICAHHARLWNRELGIRPERPRQSDFPWPTYLHETAPLTRIAVVLAILHHLMQQASPNTRWHQRLIELFDAFPDISRRALGLPDDWQADTFWNP